MGLLWCKCLDLRPGQSEDLTAEKWEIVRQFCHSATMVQFAGVELLTHKVFDSNLVLFKGRYNRGGYECTVDSSAILGIGLIYIT
jgi:hypothetical protein